jgi:hypothetical protein
LERFRAKRRRRSILRRRCCAKDLTEVMRLHSVYVRSQLAEQASEMGQAVSRAAMDAAKPKS